MRQLSQLRATSGFRPPPESVNISAIERTLGRTLPTSYRQFLTTCGGFEGFYGNTWLRLFDADELTSLDNIAFTTEAWPDLLQIGSNGGGEMFCLDYRTSPPRYAMAPYLGNLDDIIDQGPTLESFLERAHAGRLYGYSA